MITQSQTDTFYSALSRRDSAFEGIFVVDRNTSRRIDEGQKRLAFYNPRVRRLIERFTEYRLQTKFALIHHMVINESSGDIWFSYHHIPTSQDMVARLEAKS